jgi:hypothetical protein
MKNGSNHHWHVKLRALICQRRKQVLEKNAHTVTGASLLAILLRLKTILVAAAAAVQESFASLRCEVEMPLMLIRRAQSSIGR